MPLMGAGSNLPVVVFMTSLSLMHYLFEKTGDIEKIVKCQDGWSRQVSCLGPV